MAQNVVRLDEGEEDGPERVGKEPERLREEREGRRVEK